VKKPRQPGGRLRSSHPLKKAYQLTSLNKFFRTENVTGLNYIPKLQIFILYEYGSGAFHRPQKITRECCWRYWKRGCWYE